jgi:hypothetical protein
MWPSRRTSTVLTIRARRVRRDRAPRSGAVRTSRSASHVAPSPPPRPRAGSLVRVQDVSPRLQLLDRCLGRVHRTLWIAVQTGVMVVYLHEAIDRRLRQGESLSENDLRQVTIDGSVLRLRPKLMTVGVTLAALLPAQASRLATRRVGVSAELDQMTRSGHKGSSPSGHARSPASGCCGPREP